MTRRTAAIALCAILAMLACSDTNHSVPDFLDPEAGRVVRNGFGIVNYNPDDFTEAEITRIVNDMIAVRDYCWPEYQRIYNSDAPYTMDTITVDLNWYDPSHCGVVLKLGSYKLTVNPTASCSYGLPHVNGFGAELHNLMRYLEGLPYGMAVDAADEARYREAQSVWKGL